jgi:hypothetical protein
VSGRLLGPAALAALVVLGCSNTLPQAPEPGGTPSGMLRLSRERVPGVTVALGMTPSAASRGDTIRFSATATNATAQRIQIGIACGPSFDVQVTLPNGAVRSVLSDLVGPNGAFTCPLLPEHFVEPRSSRTLVLRWVVPSVRGRYVARAGLRRSDGLGNLSAAVAFSVR